MQNAKQKASGFECLAHLFWTNLIYVRAKIVQKQRFCWLFLMRGPKAKRKSFEFIWESV